jgi:lipopolysaccharide export system permease protein
MKILDKYLSRQIALFFAMLLLVLTGLAWMMQILSMLKILIQYNVSVGGFLGLTLMMIPFIATLIAPFAVFISAMFVYNRLISDREITVMMGAGLSPARVARPALILAGVLTMLHLMLSIWLVPETQERFYQKQWEMRYGLAHLALQEASFNQLADDLVVFVNKVNDRDISGLMLFDNRNPKNQIVALAEKGKLVTTVRGMSVIMANGSVQALGDTFIIGTFDAFDMDMNISDKQVKFSFKTRRISTSQLLSDINHPELFKDSEYKLLISELANRFLMPFMNLMLVLIAAIALLRASLLRRGISLAPMVATIGMAVAMGLFMTFTGVVGTLTGLGILAAAQLLIITALTYVLFKK